MVPLVLGNPHIGVYRFYGLGLGHDFSLMGPLGTLRIYGFRRGLWGPMLGIIYGFS